MQDSEVIPTAQDWPATPAAPPPPPLTARPGAPPRRRRSALVAMAAAGALILGAAVGVTIGLVTRGSATSTATTPPRSPGSAGAAAARATALYRQSLAAANASAGFHYVAVSTGGSGNQKFVGDAGQATGTQVITMDSTYGTEQFTLVLVNTIVYFQGNAPSLRDQLGVPAAKAPALVGTWISVTSGDGPYGVIAPGITVADQVGQTPLVPSSAQALPGGAVRLIGTVPSASGSTAGTAHLDIAAGSHLPTSYVVSTTVGGNAATSTTTFSQWGTAPTVTAPAGTTVTWATLGASQPPGGYGSGGSSTAPTPQP